MKLQNKLILFVIISIILPLAIITSIFIFIVSDTLKQNSISRFKNDCQELQKTVDKELLDRYLDLKTWSEIGSLKN